MKNRIFYTVLITLVLAVTGACVGTGSYFRSGLTVAVGDLSQTRVRAVSETVNPVATERNRLEAERLAAEMRPLRKHDDAVTERIIRNVDNALSQLSRIRDAYAEERAGLARAAAEQAAALAAAEEARLAAEALEAQQAAAAATEESGLTADPINPNLPATQTDPPETDASATDASATKTTAATETNPPTQATAATEATAAAPATNIDDPVTYAAYARFNELEVPLTETQRVFLLTMTDAAYREFAQVVRNVTDETANSDIAEVDAVTLTSVQQRFYWSAALQDASVVGNEILAFYLEPNYPIDEQLTEEQRALIAADYETVYVRANQTIVDENQPVTEEAYAVMEALGMLTAGLDEQIVPLVGAGLLLTTLLVACFMHLHLFREKSLPLRKAGALLCALYCVVLILLRTLGSLDYPFLPLLLFPVLVSMLIDLRTSVALTMCLTVTGYFVIDGNLAYLLFYLASGTMASLIAKYSTDRSKVFVVGFMAALCNFILSCAVSMILERGAALTDWGATLATAGYTAANGMLTVIFCVGSLPFWETFFGVVTPIKLLDLTNPTNKLLRRLTIEAPGTYHHSLIVANLAETAALDIGANPHTARVGGYYHDIGKLKYPQYFVENIAGENPHDSLDPRESVQVIISHVAHGMTLATEYRLPQFVRDICQEHHGTTVIRFFYNKAKEAAGDKPINEEDFRYPYQKPQTRESACVMLADTVEAAVRSMIPRVKSVDEVQGQIASLVRGKLNDGQLSDSELSIHDVDVIIASFFRVLKGMYHERIPYPKMPESEPAAKSEPVVVREMRRVFDTGRVPKLHGEGGRPRPVPEAAGGRTRPLGGPAPLAPPTDDEDDRIKLPGEKKRR